MLKKNLLFVILLFPVTFSGQNNYADISKNNDIISNYLHLSPRQLFDTASYYYIKNNFDTALIIYNLLINSPVKDTDLEGQVEQIRTLINTAAIYYNMCDYRTSYKHLNNALLLSENLNNTSYLTEIYNNIGNIYHRLKNFEMADKYYSNALSTCLDSVNILVLLNNLGYINIEKENPDSAFYLFNKALQISKKHNNIYSYVILNNIALSFQKQKQYDSALYYHLLSLEIAIQNHKIENEAEILSGLGNLYFETNKFDSASYYFKLSNTIASDNNFLGILVRNFLTLSKIEESKGNTKTTLEYFKQYTNIKDSLLNIEIFDEINQLQRLYEVSKTNQKIENLIVDLKVKERTIYHQKIIRRIIIFVFFFTCCIFTYILLLHNKLRKFKKNVLSLDIKSELINRILAVMDDTSIICDPKFTIYNLAELVNSNQLYVSQVINNDFKKNFRSFLNSYRIKEAQRIFSSSEAEKYTIEHVASKVGFKSRTAFRETFKEITGTSPNVYLKSKKEQKKNING